MENALIITSTEKSAASFTEILNAATVKTIITLSTCAEARRMLLERDFDLVLINAPLKDESGESLARHIATKTQVILIVSSEHFNAISAVCENDGILTISKPMDKSTLWSALKLAKAVAHRIRRVQSENSKLKQKIEDIRIVDRAKCLLISYLNMREDEAHKYIERQAMDTRSTKREVAEGILKTYEN